MNSAQEGGEWWASRPCCILPPGRTRYPLYRRWGGPQGRSGQVRKISPPPEFDPRTVQPVVSAIPTERKLRFCLFNKRDIAHCVHKLVVFTHSRTPVAIRANSFDIKKLHFSFRVQWIFLVIIWMKVLKVFIVYLAEIFCGLICINLAMNPVGKRLNLELNMWTTDWYLWTIDWYLWRRRSFFLWGRNWLFKTCLDKFQSFKSFSHFVSQLRFRLMHFQS
jgi:hypothetical protein